MRAFILSPNRAYPVTEPCLPASIFESIHRTAWGPPKGRHDPRPNEAN
jgi:hypothetical protein